MAVIVPSAERRGSDFQKVAAEDAHVRGEAGEVGREHGRQPGIELKGGDLGGGGAGQRAVLRPPGEKRRGEDAETGARVEDPETGSVGCAGGVGNVGEESRHEAGGRERREVPAPARLLLVGVGGGEREALGVERFKERVGFNPGRDRSLGRGGGHVGVVAGW